MFITFEGCEGSGKTTQTKMLYNALEKAGQSVILTREPGGSIIGERIRNLLLDPAFRNMSPITETLLFNAARAQHVDQVIMPALAAGQFVLCDRFTDSTIAYQCYGRGLAYYEVARANRFATNGRSPDLTFILDIDPAAGLTRKASQELNRLDSESIAFHRRVREGYLGAIKAEPWRCILIDASQDQDVIHQQILQIIMDKINAPAQVDYV